MAGNWDVPWMIGGGVKHSTFVARLLAYAAFGGHEGIIGSKDLQVRAREVPDGSVRVHPGACAVLNRNPHVQYDAYAARLPEEDVAVITPTGSGGWRTDLIVARVKNPFLTEEPIPEPTAQQIADGFNDFAESFVIPNVLSGTTGSPGHPSQAQIKSAIGDMSAIALASVAIPASTATIAGAYIRDQRKVANFRETTTMRVAIPTGTTTLNDTTWRDLASVDVEIPQWATHFTARAILSGASHPAGNANGNTRVVLDGIIGTQTGFNDTSTNTDRITVMTADDDVAIPEGQRGKSGALKMQGQRNGGNVDTAITSSCSVSLDVTFHMKPEPN